MVFSPEAVIHVEKGKREKEYEEIRSSPRSPFKDMLFKNIFLIAMAIGKSNNSSTSLTGKTHDLFRATTLTEDEEWLIKSITLVKDDDIEKLINESEVIKTAEEYANAGVLILYDIIFGGEPGDPIKRIESRYLITENKEVDK